MIPNRNYNLNRQIDTHTEEFERELDALCEKYGAEMETETFENED